MDDLIENAIPSSIQDLIDIFKNDLGTVTFPDVSADILDDLVKKVHSSAKDLADIQSKVQAVADTLAATQNELQQKAIRGLAYAKVFAEDREDLLEKLAQINFGKTSRVARKATSKGDDATATESKKSSKGSKKANDETVEEQPAE